MGRMHRQLKHARQVQDWLHGFVEGLAVQSHRLMVEIIGLKLEHPVELCLGLQQNPIHLLADELSQLQLVLLATKSIPLPRLFRQLFDHAAYV